MLDPCSHQTLLDALSGTISHIGRVNLDLDELHVLHQAEHPEEVGRTYRYSEYLTAHADELGHISELYLDHLMPQELKSLYQSGREHFELTLPDSAVKFVFYHGPDPQTQANHDWAYFYIARNDNKDTDLLRTITNEYLFKSCEYFVYIDPFRGNYITFVTNDTATEHPPLSGDSYNQSALNYALAYVPEDEREMVMREMALPRIIAEINRKGFHAFTCGVIEPKRGYTRKRLEYRYCDSNHTAIVLIRTDVTDLWEEEQARVAKLQQALELAYTDLLTKLLNKQGFISKAEQYLSQLKALNHSKVESSTALLFLDLDNFKLVNDTYGHQVGDKVLQAVACILKQNVKPEDIIGRYGGDEFVIVVKQVRNRKVLEELSHKILSAVVALNYHTQDGIELSCSLGAALAPQDGIELHQLLYIADRRLYGAKRRGKNMALFEDLPEHETANEPLNTQA